MNRVLDKSAFAKFPHSGLAAVDQLMAGGRFAQALQLLIPVLRSDFDDATVLDRAAVCYFRVGDCQTALKLMELLLDVVPANAAAWGKFAAMKASAGDRTGAAAAYRKALELSPENVSFIAGLNLVQPVPVNSPHVSRLKALAASATVSVAEQVLAHATLARIEEKQGNFKLAFAHYKSANELKDADYDAESVGTRVKDQARFFEACRAADAQADADASRMLFITGMPRSGTTLVESSLSRHPEICSIGESSALDKTAGAVRQYVAARGGGTGWWDWFGQLDEEAIRQFRAYFYQCAFQNERPEGRVVLDKMPLNCFELGLAHVLLPDARFVFMSRHPLDTGLSNFKTNFHAGNGFSARLEWIGHITRSVLSSVQDYQSKLGSQLRIQSYEALVSHPEEQIRALLAHAGLDWHEACLRPEENEAAVNTASLLQVREKINTGALGKWRRYQEELEPLAGALGGSEWIGSWQAWDRQAAGA